jgi:hypothetical protein
MQTLKQRGMSVKEYTEEFYRLNIRVGHIEENPEKIARYINGLRYEIQVEIGILSPNTIEQVYRFSLKVDEKLAWKQSQRGRGKNPTRSRGQQGGRGRFLVQKEDANSPHKKNGHHEVVI